MRPQSSLVAPPILPRSSQSMTTSTSDFLGLSKRWLKQWWLECQMKTHTETKDLAACHPNVSRLASLLAPCASSGFSTTWQHHHLFYYDYCFDKLIVVVVRVSYYCVSISPLDILMANCPAWSDWHQRNEQLPMELCGQDQSSVYRSWLLRRHSPAVLPIYCQITYIALTIITFGFKAEQSVHCPHMVTHGPPRFLEGGSWKAHRNSDKHPTINDNLKLKSRQFVKLKSHIMYWMLGPQAMTALTRSLPALWKGSLLGACRPGKLFEYHFWKLRERSLQSKQGLPSPLHQETCGHRPNAKPNLVCKKSIPEGGLAARGLPLGTQNFQSGDRMLHSASQVPSSKPFRRCRR